MFDQRFIDGEPVAFTSRAATGVVALDSLSKQVGARWQPLNFKTIVVIPSSADSDSLDLRLSGNDLNNDSEFPGFHANGFHTFQANGTGRTVFESIAKESGLTVLFDKDYRDGGTFQLRLEGATVTAALDIVSAMNKTLWSPISSKVIIVAPDSTARRFDLLPQIFKIYYPSSLSTAADVQAAARSISSTVSLAGWTVTPTAIIFKDTPLKMAAAEKMLAQLEPSGDLRSSAMELDATGNLFMMESSGLSNVTPLRDALKPKTVGPFTIDSTDTPSALYEQIGNSAGIRVVFDPNFKFSASTLELHLNQSDLYDALGILALQTGTFWTPLDRNTILVAGNNAPGHRLFDPQAVRVFSLPRTVTSAQVIQVMNVVRQILNATNMVVETHANAIVIRDEPRKLVMAAWLIQELAKPIAGIVPVGTTEAVRISPFIRTGTVSNLQVRDSFSILEGTPLQTSLRPANLAPISLDVTGDVRTVYEAVAKRGQIDVIFDSQMPSPLEFRFHIETAELAEALNILAVQTRTYVKETDGRTIRVGPATAAVFNDPQFQTAKIVWLQNVRSPGDLNSILNVTRQVLSIQSGTVLADSNAIEFHATAEQVAAAEKLIAALDVP
jgi:type II secretory pathway component GspD/PulD (secretin)